MQSPIMTVDPSEAKNNSIKILFFYGSI